MSKNDALKKRKVLEPPFPPTSCTKEQIKEAVRKASKRRKDNEQS